MLYVEVVFVCSLCSCARTVTPISMNMESRPNIRMPWMDNNNWYKTCQKKKGKILYIDQMPAK